MHCTREINTLEKRHRQSTNCVIHDTCDSTMHLIKLN